MGILYVITLVENPVNNDEEFDLPHACHLVQVRSIPVHGSGMDVTDLLGPL